MKIVRGQESNGEYCSTLRTDLGADRMNGYGRTQANADAILKSRLETKVEEYREGLKVLDEPTPTLTGLAAKVGGEDRGCGE